MCLETNAVDGDFAGLEVFDHSLYSDGFVVHSLDAVVVVVKLRSGGCILPRPNECLLDIRWTQGIEPNVLAVCAIVVEGLVDYTNSSILSQRR